MLNFSADGGVQMELLVPMALQKINKNMCGHLELLTSIYERTVLN